MGAPVQTNEVSAAASATTVAVAQGSNPTSGNVNIVWVRGPSASSVTGVADTLGNTYTARGNVTEAGTGQVLYQFTAPITTGGSANTVTATYAASTTDRGIAVMEAIGTYDASNTGTDTGNNPTNAVSATNSAQPATLYMLCNDVQGGTPTVGTGFTNIGTGWATLGNNYRAQYKTVTSVGSQSGDFGNAAFDRCNTGLVILLDASAPVITVQPADQTVNDGVTANFSVTATGATSYQWKKNGSNVGTNSSSYSLTTSYADQGAQITVDCINGTGTTTSSAATLRVAFELSGTGPRSVSLLGGGPMGSGSFESYLRGTAAGAGGGTVGVSSETDTALAAAGAQLRAAGTAAETDAALALVAIQVRAAGISSETDTALALIPGASSAVGLAAETDTALPRGSARPAALSSETDAAFALQAVAIRAVGFAAETDAAFARAVARPVGLAAESDTSLSLGAGASIPVGLAAETDAALSRGSARPVSIASDAEAALALAAVQFSAVGIAVETDAAIALSGAAGTSAGLASETDSALQRGSASPAGIVAETDSALGLAALLIRSAGLAAESDVALVLAGIARRAVGIASETDTALGLFSPGAQQVGIAQEFDEALAPQISIIPTWPAGGRERIGVRNENVDSQRIGETNVSSGFARIGSGTGSAGQRVGPVKI